MCRLRALLYFARNKCGLRQHQRCSEVANMHISGLLHDRINNRETVCVELWSACGVKKLLRTLLPHVSGCFNVLSAAEVKETTATFATQYSTGTSSFDTVSTLI